VNQWIRQFRPQHIIVIGTAGGIHRPIDDTEPYKWKGPSRGDVAVSEYVHYAEFMKVSGSGNLMRHMPMDQPSTVLVNHARAVITDDSWRELSQDFATERKGGPVATIEEILSGEAVQDNPLDPMQQFLMKHFDRAGAIEMESAGVAQCLHSTRDSVHYAPGFLTVRGISDLVYARGGGRQLRRKDLPLASQEKTEERGHWSPGAAASASAFAIALTTRLVRNGQPAHPGHRTIDGYQMPERSNMSDPADTLKS
jgi:nucleoside phosphorylase